MPVGGVPLKQLKKGRLKVGVAILVRTQDNLPTCVGLDFVRKILQRGVGDDLVPPRLVLLSLSRKGWHGIGRCGKETRRVWSQPSYSRLEVPFLGPQRPRPQKKNAAPTRTHSGQSGASFCGQRAEQIELHTPPLAHSQPAYVPAE